MSRSKNVSNLYMWNLLAIIWLGRVPCSYSVNACFCVVGRGTWWTEGKSWQVIPCGLHLLGHTDSEMLGEISGWMCGMLSGVEV